MKKKLTYLFLLLLSSLMVNAQTWTIGTGTSSNGNQAYPAPYGAYYMGARHQFIYRVSELTAAGVTAGIIDRFGFNVTALNTSGIHTGFNISMKNSTTDNLTAWETGLTQVFNPVNYQPVAGWNLHNLDTPFTWDGTSNIIVEVCFNNTSYTENASTQWTTGLPTGTTRTFRADAAGVCSNTSVTSTVVSTTRPNARFVRLINKDIEAVSILVPVSGCYTNTQTVSVQIKNSGLQTIDFSSENVTINVDVTTTNPTTFSPVILNSGTLAPNATLDVIISNAYNMTATGTYNFNGSVSMSTDQNTANNTFDQLQSTNNAALTLPYTQNFNASTTLPTGWSGNMVVLSNHGTANSNGLSFNLYDDTDNQICAGILPKLGPISSSTVFKYDYRIVNWSSYPNTATTLGSNDSIFVIASTDCGENYFIIQSINTSNHTNSTTFVEKTVDLSAFAGQDVIFGFYGKWASGDYYIDFDNINIETPASIDPQALAILAPTGCFGPNQTLAVRVRNNGLADLNFATDNLTINVEVATTNAATFNPIVINTGTLAVGATQDFVITNNYDMSNVGVYNFTGTISMTSDAATGNNTFPNVSRNGNYTAPIATPYTQDFNSGTTLAGISWSGDMLIGTNHGVGNTNGLYRNMWSSTTTSNARTPKIGPINSSTSLSFEYRILNYVSTGYPGSATPTTLGANDSIIVEVSTNCGASFTNFYTITGANHTSSSDFNNVSLSLSAYNGQNIIIRFRNRWASGDYFVDIDDINITSSTTTDIELTALGYIFPNSTDCNPEQTIIAAVQNIGTDTIYFSSSNELVVTTSVTGPNALTFNPVTITNGYLAPDSVMMIEISNNYEMIISGDYVFAGSFTLTDDADNTNNTFENSEFEIIAPVGGTVTVSASAYCIGDSGYAEVTGQIGDISWQISFDGTNFNEITQGQNQISGVINDIATHYIRVETSNGNCTTFSNVETFDGVARPEVFAGDNLALCDTVLVHLFDEATASTSNVNWISSGSGSFTNSTNLNPMYSFSAADITAGSVDFILIVDNGTCTNADTMTIIFDNCNSIAKTKTLNSNVSVYPNPTNGMVNIKLANETKAFVNISNSVGQLVKSEIINNSSSVDLSNFENGVYTISVIENNQVSVHKINLMK